MPTKPFIITKSNTSQQVLNYIRNNASVNFQEKVPVVTAGSEALREIGAIIMDSPNLQNEFTNALINQIAFVYMKSRSYENPWAVFKKGFIELGEVIEEVWIEMAEAKWFNPELAEKTVFKRELPKLRSAFHVMNYQVFYKVSISRSQLKSAFLSWNGVVDLINNIIQQLYTAMNYDEFLMMKYLLGLYIIEGRLYPTPIGDLTEETIKSGVTIIKKTANDFEFMNTKYNIAGVRNYSDKSKQILIATTGFDASMDVNVLAAAFNLPYVEFIQRRILTDSFAIFDQKRLDELLADHVPNYHKFTEAELEALDSIPAVLMDESFFMIFDELMEFDEIKNPEGLYWNSFLHTWKTFSVSPFANCTVLVPAAPQITGLSVTPKSATLSRGESLQLTHKLTGSVLAPMQVTWTTNNPDVTVDGTGLVYVNEDATTATAVITATSVYDPSVYTTVTITIS